MSVIYYKNIKMFFGTMQHAVDVGSVSVLQQPAWHEIQDIVYCNALYTPTQVHGIVGHEVTSKENPQDVIHVSADFLYTYEKNVGLAVKTADCVPLVLYDEQSNCVAVVHAGWKGLCNGIVRNAMQKIMQQNGADKSKIDVFVGPCARACCYEIQTDLQETVQAILDGEKDEVVVSREHKIFLDLADFAAYLLVKEGVDKKNIEMGSAVCTICSAQFCSYRRNKNSMRNVTVAML